MKGEVLRTYVLARRMDLDRTIDPSMYSESMLRANPLLRDSCILLGLYMPIYNVAGDTI